jgi:hypothetical protein
MISAPVRNITPPRPRTTYIGNFAATVSAKEFTRKPLRIDFTPHQAFHDTGDPHRRGVEHDADGGEPVVPGHGLEAVERWRFHSFGKR